MNREYLYKLVDAVPNDKIPELERALKIMAMPEEEPTEEELDAFRQVGIERANGELKTYTIEELREEFLKEY